jgi:hypothetical protein
LARIYRTFSILLRTVGKIAVLTAKAGTCLPRSQINCRPNEVEQVYRTPYQVRVNVLLAFRRTRAPAFAATHAVVRWKRRSCAERVGARIIQAAAVSLPMPSIIHKSGEYRCFEPRLDNASRKSSGMESGDGKAETSQRSRSTDAFRHTSRRGQPNPTLFVVTVRLPGDRTAET